MQDQTKLSISNAQAEANYHIGAMQSRYDTFKEEAQYLVAAQQIRLINIERDLYLCDEIIYKISNKKYRFNNVELGALFVVASYTDEKYTKTYFVTPKGTGVAHEFFGHQAICATPDAPIIKIFLGLTEGDEPENIVDSNILIDFDGVYIKSIQ